MKMVKPWMGQFVLCAFAVGVTMASVSPSYSSVPVLVTADVSPFFQLRNDSAPRTPEAVKPSPSPDTPTESEASTPSPSPEPENEPDANEQQKNVTDTEASSRSEAPHADSPSASTDDSDGAKIESSPTDVESTASSQETTQPSPDSSSNETKKTPESGAEPEEDMNSTPPETEERALPQRMESRYTQTELLTPILSSRDTEMTEIQRGDTIFRPELLAADTVTIPAAGGSAYTIASWIWWTLGGSALLLLGLFAWMRRRRVKVIETHSLDSYEYFRREFEKQSDLLDDTLSDTETNGRPADDESVEPSDNEPPEAGKASFSVWEASDEQLREAGIDPRYRPILSMYYEKGYEPETIVEESGFGPGEVGLVIDLVRRNFFTDPSSRNPS